MAPDTSSAGLDAPFPAVPACPLSLKVPLLKSTDASFAYASGTGKAPPALALVDTICLVLRPNKDRGWGSLTPPPSSFCLFYNAKQIKNDKDEACVDADLQVKLRAEKGFCRRGEVALLTAQSLQG